MTDTRTRATDPAQLGLGSVLVSSLPAALMTDQGPDRYTVEAVFTRRPAQDEMKQILSGATREILTNAGYSTVELQISDRRLEIANTNLEELRDGLAKVLADRLEDIGTSLRTTREATAARLQHAVASEQARLDAVRELAESVSFRTSEAAHD